jgi:REP element-mobilizing transposase RayT
MSTGYKITDQQACYFLTFTIVQWADIFTRQVYRDIVTDSFNHCIQHKGLRVHAYVFMSNHIHCILSAQNGNLSGIIRDLKSFTGKQIIDQIQRGPESRREWLLLVSKYAAGGHARNKEYQIWTHENHAKEMYSSEFISQKMHYLHMNPVRAGLVPEPHHWVYSSAADYCHGKQIGNINTSLLEL